MVKPPSSANTREGLRMPSFSLNQPVALAAAPVTASLTAAPALRMPSASPRIMSAPNWANCAGRPRKNSSACPVVCLTLSQMLANQALMGSQCW